MAVIDSLSKIFQKKISKLNGIDFYLSEAPGHIIIRRRDHPYPQFIFLDSGNKIDFWCYPYLGKTIHFDDIESMALFSGFLSLPGNYYDFFSSLVPEPAENPKYIMPWENMFN
jgi:hypothetical protein